MPGESSEPCVYRASPWRQFWAWLVFGPIILFCLVLALVFSKRVGDAIPLLFFAFLWAAVPLLMTLLVRCVRLNLTTEGVRLKQFGYILEMDWPHVTAMRLKRGSEGLITNIPISGKGAERLARLRTFGMIAVPFYDAEQQALLAEKRLIPIEPFAWHLHHGQLRDDIVRFAPHLRETLDSIGAPEHQPPRLAVWKAVAFIAPFLLGAIALAESPKAIQDRILGIAGLVFLPLLTIRAAYSVRTCFRTRAWFLGVFFLVLTLLFLLFSVGLWIDLFATPRD